MTPAEAIKIIEGVLSGVNTACTPEGSATSNRIRAAMDVFYALADEAGKAKKD